MRVSGTNRECEYRAMKIKSLEIYLLEGPQQRRPHWASHFPVPAASWPRWPNSTMSALHHTMIVSSTHTSPPQALPG